MPSEKRILMDKIYTKDRCTNQSIAVVSSEDVERAEHRRVKRDKRRARRASSAVQKEDIRVSKRITGRRIRTAERRVARDLGKPTKQRRSKRLLSSPLLSVGGTYFFVFVGEWGYELLSSHGWLRKLKYEHPEIKIGVASRAGVEFLYEDACDVYVDITDVLAKYRSHMFGVRLSEKDRKIVEDRCTKAADGKCDGINYSNASWNYYGISYGRPIGKATRAVRDSKPLNRQLWKQLTLKGLEAERREIEEAFPDLLNSDYIIVQDRYREVGWGKRSYDASTWKAILSHLVDIGYHPVLIGYEHWKLQDAKSIFTNDEFKNIPGTLNITDFLTDHLERNLAYQAVLFKHAQFWLGVYGSASMLAPLLGTKSYVLSADRAKVARQEWDESGWREPFRRCGGSLEYINTLLTEESVMLQLKSKKLGNQTNPKSYSIESKKNRVAVFSLCWNRLHYTKHCFNSLWEKAGMDFDHFVIDNGSTDGTKEWLLENEHRFKGIIRNEENLGIGNAIMQMVMLAKQQGYDWFMTGSNDIEILTDDFIKKMYEFWKMTKGQYIFSPEIGGITHIIKVLEKTCIEGYNVEVVDATGGVYIACPTSLLEDYLASTSIWRANDLCRFAAKKGIKNLYLSDLKVTHYEMTAGQMRRYPDMKKGYNRDIGGNLRSSLGLKSKKRPFMSFVTRCYKRPRKLAQCITSINNQTDKDFEHVFIKDDVGRGLEWANKQLYEHRERVKGEYVYICDDDDRVSDTSFVAIIKKIAHELAPDVIMTKLLRRGKQYPTAEIWGKDPIKGKIAVGCFCAKNEIYQKHIEAFGKPRAGDYYFIKEVFEGDYKIHWLDRIVMAATVGRGRCET